ncbi:MAG: glycosyltransferase family 39 protein [Chitinivibrionales bacterium]|nr:glycosyltransferase family 39 protein [Chitinivibrionales bacterium]
MSKNKNLKKRNRQAPPASTEAKRHSNRWESISEVLKSNALPLILIVISLIVNMTVLADYCKSPFAKDPVWDANTYWKWAQEITSGNWLGSKIFHQTPLYPYFLSFFVLIFGKALIPIYLAQSLLSTGSALLVYSITKTISGKKVAGFIAGLLFVFYGMQVFYFTKILSECLSIFLMLLTTRLLLIEKPSTKQLISAGIAAGLLIIAKPYFILAVPLVLLYLSFHGKHDSMRHLFLRLTQFLLPIMALMAIVAIRNYAVEKDFVLISSNGGENFFIGNHEKADGVYAPVEGISRDIEYQNEDVNQLAEHETGHLMKRSEVSSFWFRQGVSFIRHHPKTYLKLEWTKLKFMFSGAERSTMHYLYFEKKNITASYAIPFINFYLLFPLFAAGFLLALSQWKRYILLIAFLLVNMLNILIFFYDTRFMLLAMPYWIILGGVAAWHIGQTAKTAGFLKALLRPATIILFITAGLAVYIYSSDAKVNKPDWHMYMTLGDINLDLNDLEAARKAYTQSSSLNQNDWMPVFGISKVYFRKGNKDIAAQLYNEAFPNLKADFKKMVLRDKDLEPVREYIQEHKAAVPDNLPNKAIPVGLDNPHS